MHQLVKQFSRLACIKSKVQLLGRMVARGGKAKSEALMILVRGKQIEGGVYSCSAYEQYHLKSQKCSSKRWIKKHERISRFNDSTAVHTSYPNLQVSNPILTQEGALLKRNPSDCDITLEEGFRSETLVGQMLYLGRRAYCLIAANTNNHHYV